MRRPALDGLRALAVLAVMAYHFSYGHYPGGFLGVELFFVLSGYLITSLLLAEYQATGTVSLARFYMRRVLRLGPALLLGMVVANAVMIVLRDPEITPSLGLVRADLAVVLYLANWVQVPAPGDIGALSHAWSLAVEEQFYLLWPAALLFFVLARSRAPWRWALAGALAAAVVTVVALAVSRKPGNLYYLSSSHAIGLLLGCTAALLPRARLLELCRQPAAMAGLVVLFAMSLFVNLTDGWMYAGGFLLASLAGTVLVAHCANVDSTLARALGYAPLTFVGRISYGLYLYHFPIFLAAKHFVLPHSHVRLALLMTAGFAATFVVATVSYELVEKPALRLKDRWRSRGLGVPAAVTGRVL